MKHRRVLPLLFASLIALVLLLGSVGTSAAFIGPPIKGSTSSLQPPVTLFQIVSIENRGIPGQELIYTVSFHLSAPAKNVTLEVNFLNGQDLLSGPPSTKVFSSANRNTYDFSLGDLAAGDFEVIFSGRVDPNHPQGPGQNVKTTATLYTSEGWKASSTVPVPVMLET
jgi:hypothetical protein